MISFEYKLLYRASSLEYFWFWWIRKEYKTNLEVVHRKDQIQLISKYYELPEEESKLKCFTSKVYFSINSYFYTWTCPVSSPEWLITKESFKRSNICFVSLNIFKKCFYSEFFTLLFTFLDLWEIQSYFHFLHCC